MRVWVLQEPSYEWNEVLGVYGTKEALNTAIIAWMMKYRKHDIDRWENLWESFLSAEEFEVQGMPNESPIPVNY